MLSKTNVLFSTLTIITLVIFLFGMDGSTFSVFYNIKNGNLLILHKSKLLMSQHLL